MVDAANAVMIYDESLPGPGPPEPEPLIGMCEHYNYTCVI